MSVIVGLILVITLTSANSANEKLQVLQSSNLFTRNLYKVLSKEDGNICFSPLSIHTVLSMAYQGASGTTAQAFANTLNIPQAKSAANGYQEIITSLNNAENITLSVANKVFLMKNRRVLDPYRNSITKDFKSEVESLDFEQNEAAANTINKWVKEQTHDKIDNLVQKDDFDYLTRLVLVNGIYFKGKWAKKFGNAYPGTFYFNNGTGIEVPLMFVNGDFSTKYSNELQAQILQLPYVNEDFALVIILPFEKDGISNVEKKLAETDITKVTEGLGQGEVDVVLPKFKIEQKFDLNDALTSLGLKEIFDKDKANFREMIELNQGESLYVSKVAHKTFLEITEEGTEAAAATGILLIQPISAPPSFYVDHPFIFLLRQKSTNEILFYGRILNPANLL